MLMENADDTRDALEVQRWLHRGLRLTADEVSELEGSLASDPDAREARGLLLIHYGATTDRGGPDVAARHSEQLTWWIAHAPASLLCGLAQAHIDPASADRFARAGKEWLIAVKAAPTDLAVLCHAAAFFGAGGDWKRARALLTRALRRAPHNDVVHLNLAGVYWREARSGDRIDRTLASQAARHYATAARASARAPDFIRFSVLASAAEAAYHAGDLPGAARSARRLLQQAGRAPSRRRDAARAGAWSRAHSLLGLVDLRRGRLREAATHLGDSLAPGVVNYGDLNLAAALLLAGERTAVVQFLRKYDALRMPMAWKVAPWIAQIEDGWFPEFGRALTF